MTTTSRKQPRRAAVVAGILALFAVGVAAAPAAQGADQPGTTGFDLTVSRNSANPRLTGANQGFSVESADFAHGFLTRDRMAQRLRTLSSDGVLRLGGYSMDLVWPAFGAWANTPAPPEAIGGTVDQSDLDALKGLLDASGWKVTLGVPLKTVIDPSKIKNPTRDVSPDVSLDQVVAEVVAAHATLGDHLLSVEVGNEFDNVTTLTSAEMWETMKQYQEAIDAALPGVGLKVGGPSANTATTNTRLDEFVTAATSDTSTRPEDVLAELDSHWYPGSHCGTSTMTIAQLMSATTHTRTQTKLEGIQQIASRLHHPIPSAINESNSASCSGMPGVSDSYASTLWSLDYLLEAAKSGMSRVNLHTNTAAICGDFKARDSADYPISYRYYGAFCARDQAELASGGLSAAPLYYGLWAFSAVPQGRFMEIPLDPDNDLKYLRAYALEGPRDTMTVVLVNVQDPAGPTSTTDQVRLQLPNAFNDARQVTLHSTDPAGLASLNASVVTLGGAQVDAHGAPTAPVQSVDVPLTDHRSTTLTVAPGTATITTFAHR